MAAASVIEPPLSVSVLDGIFGGDFVASFNGALKKGDGSQPGGHSSDSEEGGSVKLKLGGAGILGSSIGQTSFLQTGSLVPKIQHVEITEKSRAEDARIRLALDVEARKPTTKLPKRRILREVMDEKLDVASSASRKDTEVKSVEGRLGPHVVKLDALNHVGSFVMTADRLGITAQCNFGSVKANVCVFKGKWQYEIQINSRGVMQLGWATANTRFAQERGVGDFRDSFAYDGNRVRKWNVAAAPYGEAWNPGDAIGCCIDLDNGTIEFSRNGKSMGIAFENIPRGPGIAYFPAVSLAWGESISINFGETPLQFPVTGYQTPQAAEGLEDSKTQVLLSWLDRILALYPNPDLGRVMSVEDYRTLLVCASGIFESLGPNIRSPFVIQNTFLPYFGCKIGLPAKITSDDVLFGPYDTEKCHLLLDLMWTFLEESEMKACIEQICNVFTTYFRNNALTLAFPFQVYSLQCVIALASHRRTRRHLIHHVLFEHTRLMHFLHVKPVDEDLLRTIIPVGWWTGKSDPSSKDAMAYELACNVIQERIGQIEKIQVTLLKILLTNSDGSEKRPSSRSLFLRKFREHIRESIRPSSVLQHPLNKAMCTFFRILQVIAALWSEEIEQNESLNLPDIPHSMFFDLTVNYHDSERLGGLANFLYKTHHMEVSQAMSCPDYMATRTEDGTPIPSFFRFGSLHGIGLQVLSTQSTPTVTMASASEASNTLSGASGRNLSTATSDARPSSNVGTETEIHAEISSLDGVQVIIPARSMNEGTSGTPAFGIIHPPSAITAFSVTENIPDLRLASATSSAEDMTAPIVRGIGGSLIAGTASGTHMMIPLDFPMDGNVRLFAGGFLGFSAFEHRIGPRPQNRALQSLGRDSGTLDTRTSLRELLDDAILIYSCGVKKHAEKVVIIRKITEEYVKAVEEARQELTKKTLTPTERAEVQKSIDIFLTKLDEQGRHLGWCQAAIFTVERQQLVFQLMKVMLTCLKQASAEGVLFSFVPEFYVTTLIQLTWFLLAQMHPTVPYTNLPGIDAVLQDIAEFVAAHFSDSRIVVADTKDTLTQALSMFICNRTMLTALESMPETSRMNMIKSILRPYENRAWAQSNWMLVRFWQGNGFGFQYPNSAQARKAFRSKPAQDEYGISTNLAPTPSPIFQNHVARVLTENPKLATNYIHSVLNQLNWAFSEFVGLLQEIHSGANRAERAFMESRQLKVCSTCYELTQALLRVLEMVIHVAPALFMDLGQGTTQSLLGRLCMLVSQIMNRVGSSSGTFAQVLQLGITGVENITFFPILSAVAGILVALLRNEMDKTDPADLLITKTLLREPSFTVGSLDFLMGRNQTAHTSPLVSFTLSNFVPDDVSDAEIRQIEAVMWHMASWAPRLDADNESISDDDICTICYAYAKSVSFEPCHHRSCRTCILHHLMNRGECFFCKGIIQKVIADDGSVIHDITNLPESPEPSQIDISRH